MAWVLSGRKDASNFAGEPDGLVRGRKFVGRKRGPFLVESLSGNKATLVRGLLGGRTRNVLEGIHVDRLSVADPLERQELTHHLTWPTNTKEQILEYRKAQRDFLEKA